MSSFAVTAHRTGISSKRPNTCPEGQEQPRLAGYYIDVLVMPAGTNPNILFGALMKF